MEKVKFMFQTTNQCWFIKSNIVDIFYAIKKLFETTNQLKVSTKTIKLPSGKTNVPMENHHF